MTALHVAVACARTEVVKVLLEHKANVNAISDSSSNRTALHTAAERGLPDITRMLIRHNADIYALNHYKRTPLELVTGYTLSGYCHGHDTMYKPNCMKVVEMLLKHYQVSPNKRAKKSLGLALNWAALEGNIDLAKRLLDSGVDVNTRGRYGRTPLIEAIHQRSHLCPITTDSRTIARQKQQSMKLIKLLLKRGADASLSDENKRNAIRHAEHHGEKKVIDLLKR